MEKFKTIENDTKAEIIEKKSKFIAHIFYVETPEEAEKYIKEIKKQYHDARHNVFAYAIETKDGGVAVKYNDDGEPQGTAGSPILKIILEQGLSNILVVVTRYFGGILLGTGGLVRAYSDATLKALENVQYIEKIIGYKVKICIEYNTLEQLKYYATKSNIKIVNIEYLENIEVIVEMQKGKLNEITNNGSKKPFKILKCDILEEKYIDI